MKCLVCYEDTNTLEPYHKKCSRALFSTDHAPEISFGSEQIHRLASNIVRSNTTIPGVQKKLSAHIQHLSEKGSRMTLVGLWGDYILKPHSAEYPTLPVVEDCTMNVTSVLGVSTMPHGLIRLNSGELAYITKRLDRTNSLPVWHMEDGCQLMGSLTEYKYRGSMEKLGKCIRGVVTNTILDTIRYFEMIIVSFLTGNADMHLKNFSVYYRDSTLIRLTPAYDMVSTRLLIPEKSDNEELALPLNGKKRKLVFEDFYSGGKSLGLNEKQIHNAIRRICSNLPKAIDVIQKSFLSSSDATAFMALMEKRALILESS